MKRFLFIIVFFLLLPVVVFAAPEKANNKVGALLLQPTTNDIKKAAEMINSQGGDYGYVTLVIQENDRDRGKWQGIFDELRKYHLIPIIRLATKPEGENWRRPAKEDASGWVSFLNSLNWVIKERYVILFNEPNHATEWGGEVDPKGYGEVVEELAKKLHEKNKDFFVMLAGFDASAPSYPSQYEDEGVFIRQMVDDQLSIFNNIDGWSSHSYPNPGFSGSPWDSGRKSIRGYVWELELLKELGLVKELPVFITETGWKNNCQLSIVSCQLKIADNIKIAFENAWIPDNRVVAVTPFVFDYQAEPFLGFSFKKQGEDAFYPQYDTVSSLEKRKGEPIIIESGELENQLPGEFVANSSFRFSLKLKNTGQAIWDSDSGYQLSVVSNQKIPFDYFFSDIKKLEPNQEAEVSLFLKTNKVAGEHMISITLQKNKKTIAQTNSWNFTILPIPSLTFRASLFPKLIANNEGVEIQIYDDKEGLVYKRGGLPLKIGEGVVNEVQNIVMRKQYRIVLLAPYYLPRQGYITFHKDKNTITFKPMLPLDLNNDGRWSIEDIGELFKHPNLFGLFVP